MNFLVQSLIHIIQTNNNNSNNSNSNNNSKKRGHQTPTIHFSTLLISHIEDAGA